MERKIRPGMKRKVKALRKKYCEGLCSDFYLETGIPKIMYERATRFQDEIKPLVKENDKRVKKAIKVAVKRSGRRADEEDQLIFV